MIPESSRINSIAEAESPADVLSSVSERLLQFAHKYNSNKKLKELLQALIVDLNEVASLKDVLLEVADGLVDVAAEHSDDVELREFLKEVYHIAASERVNVLGAPVGERTAQAVEFLMSETGASQRTVGKSLGTNGNAIRRLLEKRTLSPDFVAHYADISGVSADAFVNLSTNEIAQRLGQYLE